MKKIILLFALLAVTGAANAVTVTLLTHNRIASSGRLYALVWNGDDGNPASTAVWDWDYATGTLSMTGTYWATWYVRSNPFELSVYGDEVTNMTINTIMPIRPASATTSASSYVCHEGTFLTTVNANWCLNLDEGANGVTDSTSLYNVGGSANCINRTIGGDDIDTGNPRGLFNAPAGGGCDAVDGAFDLWWVVSDTPGFAGKLTLANSPHLGNCSTVGCIDATAAGVSYMIFDAPVPLPPAVWLFGSALGVMGWMRRRVA